MCLKQLNLDRARIQGSINDYFGDANTIMVQKTDTMWEIRRVVDNQEMILQFHYLYDGRTTLGHKVGKNQAISKKLAEFIKTKALVDPRHNIYLSFKNFAQESFDDLMTYLSSANGVKLSEDQKKLTGQRVLHYTGNQNDVVTIVYHSNLTLQLQGRPVTLYCQVIAFMAENLSLGDIIESQSKFIPIPLKLSDIEYELDAKLPLSYSKLDPTTRKMLGASIAFAKLNIELPDYTAFAFPALRALEGQIKTLFHGKGITISGKDSLGPYFFYDGAKRKLKSEIVSRINCQKTRNAIEHCYNYYWNHRHSLFHAEAVAITSSIIEKRDEAIGIIDTVLGIFEDTQRILSS